MKLYRIFWVIPALFCSTMLYMSFKWLWFDSGLVDVERLSASFLGTVLMVAIMTAVEVALED